MKNKNLNPWEKVKKSETIYAYGLCTLYALMVLFAGAIISVPVTMTINLKAYVIFVIIFLSIAVTYVLFTVLCGKWLKKKKANFELQACDKKVQQSGLYLHITNDEKDNTVDRLLNGEKIEIPSDILGHPDGRIYVQWVKEPEKKETKKKTTKK